MNVLVPINHSKDIKSLAESGADEFYVGFYEASWDSNNKFFYDLNRMSGFEEDANHYSLAELIETSVYKGYKQDKIEMRGDRAEMSDFPLYLNMVAGGLDCRDQAIGGFSFVVKIYAVPVVEIIG